MSSTSLKKNSPENEKTFSSLNRFNVSLLDPYKLKEHQEAVLDWMIQREKNPVSDVSGGFLALEMGLGKTLLALVNIMRARGPALPVTPGSSNFSEKYTSLRFPALVTCPLNAIYTWQKEMDKFFGSSCRYLIVRPGLVDMDELTVEQLCGYDIVITNFEVLRTIATKNKLYNGLFKYNMSDKLIGISRCAKPSTELIKNTVGPLALFNCPYSKMFVDESHHVSNPKSQIFYTLMCLWAEHKWCLTGTPIRNWSSDLFSQFRILGFSKVMKPKDFTLKLYLDSNLAECILYMTVEDAGIELPKKRTITIPIELEGKEKQLYETFRRETKETIEGYMNGAGSTCNILTLFTRLRQCCICPYTILSDDASISGAAKLIIETLGDDTVKWINDINGTAGIGAAKISRCIKLIEHIPTNDKILVFAEYKRTIRVLEAAMKHHFPTMKYEVIDGSVTREARDKALDRFRTDESNRILFMTRKTGSESLNLVVASHVIVMDCDWVPANEDQAEARAHRIGQTKTVTVYRLVAENTIEGRMLAVCGRKRELFNKFITDHKTVGSDRLDMSMIYSLIMPLPTA